MISSLGAPVPNDTLQVMCDPLPTFAAAKAIIDSNAPERGR
jgi:hypothetical protein